MKKILLLMSFIGAGYAASFENLPPLLVKNLTDSGKNGAQYVLLVNKYDAQPGYYADIWAFDGKELKHAKHIKNADVAKIIGSGETLLEENKALNKDLNNSLKTAKKQKATKAKKTESTENKREKQSEAKKGKDDAKKASSKSKIKRSTDSLTKKDAKKELANAKDNYKKTGDAIDKAKTEKTKMAARAAHARAGKALIKAENAAR